jgi:hypothetical protein
LVFFGVKILEFFDADPGSRMETVRIRDPGWKKVGSGIRDKHPGSATPGPIKFFSWVQFALIVDILVSVVFMYLPLKLVHDFYVKICSKIAVVMELSEASGLAAHEDNCC